MCIYLRNLLYTLITVSLHITTTLGSISADSIFVYFSAQQASNDVLISFTIRGGVTCQGVQVMRSSDNINFVSIYDIQGVCGNLSFDETYNWTDATPHQNQNNYYRVDLGSLGISSDIITVPFIKYNGSGYHMFPNPCKNDCRIYFSNANHAPHQYIIFDGTGSVVYSGETDGDEIYVDSNLLSSGIYRFIVYQNSESRFNGNFVYLE